MNPMHQHIERTGVFLLPVNVTATDIAMGCPWNQTHCPIALAVKRRLPNCKVHVSTQEDRIEVKYADMEYVADLPDNAANFTLLYDADEPVQPIAFVAKFKPKITVP